MTNDTVTLDAQTVVARLRATFRTGRTKPIAWRRTQLEALRTLLQKEDTAFLQALHTDIGKGEAEARRTEVDFIINEIDHTLENLDAWLAPEDAPIPGKLQPATGRVVREPLGVSLIVGPWNYPLHLALAPLVGTIAAGNCAVVKPSELAPSVSAAIARLLPEYLDTDAFAVVEGAIPETTALLEQKFDHIFYTGNGAVGRIVMTAAAKHLTPVALELGGKSPAVVDTTADLAIVAQRIAWGKFLNAGQTCVAPDYVLAIGDAAQKIEPLLAEAVRALHGDDPSKSPEYGRIIATRHFDRLAAMLGDGRTVVGGQSDRDTRYIAPTVLADVDPASEVMAGEIFGPILPIVSVPDVDAAIEFITSRDKPLALYAFTESEETKQRLLDETSSGALCFGMPVVHLTASDLPFGGVGESGMGRYHGKYSIDTFSHLKAVLDKPIA